jgi:ABC-type transport system involved in multi-copper enzyme maturation permease subunit
MAIVALAAAFIASEYDRGTIRITLAASPRRGRVLAAKAVVIGAVTSAAGLVAGFASILLAGPLLPTTPSLLDGPVLRATVGTAALLPVVAVLSLAVATIVRRGAAAITIVLLALLVPPIVAGGVPLSVALWLGRVTPAAGFAIQETVRRYDTAIAPLAGFAVLCGYTAVALGIASWRLGERDA